MVKAKVSHFTNKISLKYYNQPRIAFTVILSLHKQNISQVTRAHVDMCGSNEGKPTGLALVEEVLPSAIFPA